MKRRMRAGAIVVAAYLACTASVQEPPVDEALAPTFDLTGAGTLELGDINAVLASHRRAIDQGDGRLTLTLVIDSSGAVTGCESEAPGGLDAAVKALCDHALAQGRFEKLSILDLNFTQATYHLTVRQRTDSPGNGSGPFFQETGYPDLGVQVRFPGYTIPTPDNRLASSDLRVIPMSYPQSALSRAIEARVVVALFFGEDGRVARCRPVLSSSSSRMAYETCRAAHRSYRLLNPPDPRPYAMATNWIMAD